MTTTLKRKREENENQEVSPRDVMCVLDCYCDVLTDTSDPEHRRHIIVNMMEYISQHMGIIYYHLNLIFQVTANKIDELKHELPTIVIYKPKFEKYGHVFDSY